MTGAPARGADPGEHWPRGFDRDPTLGLLTLDRATRAREVSTTVDDEERMVLSVLAGLLARVDGRR